MTAFEDQHSLAGRRVAVTGAASGIGREVVRVFSAAGASVAALDVAVEGLGALAAETDCVPVACDVTRQEDVDRAFVEVEERIGGLDILVTNAGAAAQGRIGDVSIEVLQRSFDLNFFGHQRVCQAALRIFRRQGQGGTILFNISNQSVNPGKDFGPYGLPKAATLALMRQYAVDHGPEGIRVNGINAGRIRTGLMTDEMIVERARARGITPHEYMAGNLLGVEVTATDIAKAFLHLAQMDKVNAAVLTVDGGAIATAMR
jgi:NAD(P)-dependent dehydrogenase (short-subunit alcohol dehydrogenase family)